MALQLTPFAGRAGAERKNPMSYAYNSFAAHAFGPVLAQLVLDEGDTRLTSAYVRRAEAGWNLTAGAMVEVVREATRCLADPDWVAEYQGRVPA